MLGQDFQGLSMRHRHADRSAQDGPGTLLDLGRPIRRRQVRGAVPFVQDGVRNLPGLEDRLGETRAGVGGFPLTIGDMAAQADDKKQRQPEVMDKVAKRVARLEQAGTLDGDHGTPTAQEKPAGDGNGLAFPTDSH